VKIFRFIPTVSVTKNTAVPTAMKKIMPDWYKNGEKYFDPGDGGEAPGLKTCLPVLDAMTAGYALVTPVDVYVSKNEKNELKIEWDRDKIKIEVVAERKGQIGSTIPRPAGHENNHLTWNGQWGWKVPRGFSVLVTHPLNRFDLPFTTMSGIVDSDVMFAPGMVPFFIKSGFEGVIPAGTPIAQLIPIKRYRWSYLQNWVGSKKIMNQGQWIRSGKATYRKVLRKEKTY
jgi:hypothetical protein